MKTRIGAMLALLVALAAPAAVAQQARATWDLPAGYNDANFHTQNLRWFAAEVKSATKGEIDIQIHGNASLYKLPEIKRSVQSGLVPIGEILLSMHGNEDAIYEADMIPFLAAGFDRSWRLYQVQKPMLEQRLAKSGLRLLYSVAWPGNGLFTKTPIDSLAAMKGAKFRAYNPITARFAEELGAQPVTIQAPEIGQAFMTGMATVMIASPQIGVDSKAWDYLSSFYDANAMHPRNAVVVNEAAFGRLSKESQAALLRVAAQAESRGWELAKAAAKGSTDTMAKNGLKVVEPSPPMRAEFERVGRKLIVEWSKRAGADGEAIVKAMQ